LLRRHEHEAHPLGGGGVFRLLCSPQDDEAVVWRCVMFNISQSIDQTFEVNCGPQSEVIILGTPKWDIQENINALAHATTEISDKGRASIDLDVRSMTLKTNPH
jgi:hypothetical protein